MPTNKYSTSKKKKLVNRIGKLKKKKEYHDIYNIIQKNDDVPVKHSDNEVILFFHNLNNKTYIEIEKYLDSKLNDYKENRNDSEMTEEYKSYSQDDFPDEKNIDSKFKYSNKEKNLIKRKRYDKSLNEENGSNIVYCDFDINNLSENKTDS